MTLEIASIFLYKDYPFGEGYETKNKLFVVINIDQVSNKIIVCITTSQNSRSIKNNCNSQYGYFYSESKSFKKNTFILFSKLEFREFDLSQIQGFIHLKYCVVVNRLLENEYYDLYNCIVLSDDLTGKQKKSILLAKY